MDSAIRGDLFMRNAQFKEALVGLRVGVFMSSSRFNRKLNMNSASIGGDLFMKNAEFKDVLMGGVLVDSQLTMVGSKFDQAQHSLLLDRYPWVCISRNSKRLT